MGQKVNSSRKEDNFFALKVTIVLGLTAWPFTYLVNAEFVKLDQDKRTLAMMCVGFALFGIMCVIKKVRKQGDWLKYVFALFAFTSMIDLIIALELKGWIGGFMSVYLDIGEPYLSSTWGYAITLFDGIFFYVMHLLFVHLMSNRRHWRSLGIYWTSGIINSMIVLLVGIATGKHNPTLCTFLNVPYVLVPVFVGIRLFSVEKLPYWNLERARPCGFLFDVTIAIGLIFSIWVVFVKGMLSLGSNFEIFQSVLGHERVLLDANPAPFAIVQSLVYLFYSLPILLLTLGYIFQTRKPQFIWDLALVNGGLFLQGQFSFIATALDFRTPLGLRADPLDSKFWLDNLALLIVPQMLLWSLYESHISSKMGGSKTIVKNK